MNILVLQPCNPIHWLAKRADGVSLAEAASQLLNRLPAANPGLTLEIVRDSTALEVPPHPSKYIRHAMIRNHMLDTYLRDHHDVVLWIDSDLVDYPAEIPTLLVDAGPIAAPYVYLDRCLPRFYDIGGFIEHGKRFAMYPPYCSQEGPVVQLDSVGSLYTFPAALYRAGLRYSSPTADYYVEHLSVMEAARAQGVPVVALSEIKVLHAYLPEYGLGLN